MIDYFIKEDVFMALTGDITDCTIEEFIAKLRDKLSKLPSVGKDINVTTNEDCISRRAVFEILKNNRYHFNISQEGCCEGKVLWSENLIKDDVGKEIQQLPSVTPKEKTGKGEWLRMSDLSEQEDDRYKCSRCGNVVHYRDKINLYTFNSWCGRCGSDNGRKIEVSE